MEGIPGGGPGDKSGDGEWRSLAEAEDGIAREKVGKEGGREMR